MPNTTSAKKMLRRNTRVYGVNKAQKSAMKTSIRKYMSEKTDDSLNHMKSLVARAGRKNLIPEGRARRIVSRLSRKMPC